MNLRDSFLKFNSTDPWRKVVLENALDAVVGMNQENVIVDWNIQAENIFGWKKEEVIGQKLADLIIPPSYRQPHMEGIEHFLKTGEGPILNKRIEVTALRRAGEIFPVELTVIPINLEGNFIFYSFIRDITAKKKLESEKDEILSRFKAIIDQSIVGFAQVDKNGKFLDVNEFYCEMVGRKKDELMQMMGMKVGKGTMINTTNISDPCLIEIGDYVTIGGSATLVAHYGMKGFLIIDRLIIEDKATIGLKATVFGDVVIGKGATVKPNEVVMPKTRIPARDSEGVVVVKDEAAG